MTSAESTFTLPFVVCVKGMGMLQVAALADKLRYYYNADFHLSADLFFGGLSDDFDSAKKNDHEHGPYIGVNNNRTSTPNLFSCRAIPDVCSVFTEAELDEFEALGIKPVPGRLLAENVHLNPGTTPYIVRRQLGQIYNNEIKEYRVMANSPEDADRRLNAMGRTISITR